MSKRKPLTPPERAARFAEKAIARIRAAEKGSARPTNVELELALAWLAGHQETKDYVLEKVPKP